MACAVPVLQGVEGAMNVLRILWIFLAALALAPVASAEIFKCTAKNGLDLYQNFPC